MDRSAKKTAKKDFFSSFQRMRDGRKINYRLNPRQPRIIFPTMKYFLINKTKMRSYFPLFHHFPSAPANRCKIWNRIINSDQTCVSHEKVRNLTILFSQSSLKKKKEKWVEFRRKWARVTRGMWNVFDRNVALIVWLFYCARYKAEWTRRFYQWQTRVYN